MSNFSRISLIALLILSVAACKESAPPERPEVARPAKIFNVEAPGASHIRTFPGEVRATNEAELAFRVSGELVEFSATRGKRVKQGELLARLDRADYQAVVASAQAQYDLALAQYNRAAELVERQLIAQADFEKNEALMKVRRSSLEQARNNLDYTSIYAPFDGVVARRLAENFESVAAGQVVLVLQTGDMVDVIIDVPESIVARIQRTEVNQNPHGVSVRFDSASDQVFEASYKEHEAQADSATLTYKVTVSLKAPDEINILPGMTATVIADIAGLLESGGDGFLVPIEAVFAAEDAALDSDVRYVWKVDPETMRTIREPVKVGALTGDSIIVLEGLEENDLIIAAGVNSVQQDMLVRAMSREAGL
jgi:RND family efflux transporter MFP subunit